MNYFLLTERTNDEPQNVFAPTPTRVLQQISVFALSHERVLQQISEFALSHEPVWQQIF